ncbi:MAG: hypothetical protein AAF654_01760 [Myxococcota bacterium]
MEDFWDAVDQMAWANRDTDATGPAAVRGHAKSPRGVVDTVQRIAQGSDSADALSRVCTDAVVSAMRMMAERIRAKPGELVEAAKRFFSPGDEPALFLTRKDVAKETDGQLQTVFGDFLDRARLAMEPIARERIERAPCTLIFPQDWEVLTRLAPSHAGMDAPAVRDVERALTEALDPSIHRESRLAGIASCQRHLVALDAAAPTSRDAALASFAKDAGAGWTEAANGTPSLSELETLVELGDRIKAVAAERIAHAFGAAEVSELARADSVSHQHGPSLAEALEDAARTSGKVQVQSIQSRLMVASPDRTDTWERFNSDAMSQGLEKVLRLWLTVDQDLNDLAGRAIFAFQASREPTGKLPPKDQPFEVTLQTLTHPSDILLYADEVSLTSESDRMRFYKAVFDAPLADGFAPGTGPAWRLALERVART